MSWVVVLTGLAAGGTAAALTPWLRELAGTGSAWTRSFTHVVVAALGGAGAALLARGWVELTAFVVLAVACALLVVVDLTSYRLPDRITLPTYPVLAVLLTAAAAVENDWTRLGRAAAAAAVLLVAYFVLAFINPDGLGLGDVKLAGLLGAFLGWFGWNHVLMGTLAAFVLGAVFGLGLVVTRRANRHTAFPFGPWMVAGAAVGAAWGSAGPALL